MKTLTLFILLLLWQDGGGGNRLTRIAETNRLKQAAADAYAEGKYAEAASIYEVIITKWGDTSDAIQVNRANALLQAQKKEEAAQAYRQIAEGKAGKAAKSTALQQLGYLAAEEDKLPDALQYFKESLKANPGNETARRNYELAWQSLQKQEKDPEQQEKEDKPEDQPKINPSAWAQQQKAKADALYKQFRYAEALRLMQNSLQQDSTIAAYNDYMRRLSDITEIDQ